MLAANQTAENSLDAWHTLISAEKSVQRVLELQNHNLALFEGRIIKVKAKNWKTKTDSSYKLIYECAKSMGSFIFLVYVSPLNSTVLKNYSETLGK